MYVIASYGHCVINGLGQVKVFETRERAQFALDGLRLNQGDRGFEVQEVDIVKNEEYFIGRSE